MTVFALREALAGIGEGGAASVEAVGIVVRRLRERLAESQVIVSRARFHLLAVIANPFRDYDGA